MIWRCDSAAVSVWVDKIMCCWWRPEFAVQHINKDEMTEAAYMAALRTRGQEYLNENKVFENFEAEAEADVNFTYQKDYDLGDVVTVKKKKWGTSQNLRITELCEVYEYGGMYVVPTFGDALPTAIKWDD